MFCKVWLIACLLLSSGFKGEEKTSSSCCAVLDNDTITLKGFSFVNFFLCVPSYSIEEAKKINKLAILDLEKFGKVISTSLNVQNPTEGINDPNSSFKSPSIFYKIEHIRDMEGNFVDLAVASFELKGGAYVKKTKDYFEPCFWSCKCYVKTNSNKDLTPLVSKTLNFLLIEFNKDFQQSNNSSKEITFYFQEIKAEK